ncbi:MAG TPA: hypothetical protein VIL25_10970 [Vicinamibacterales bacterium]
MPPKVVLLCCLALAALPTAGCGSSSASPTPVRIAVIRVGDEAFRVALPTPELVEAARAAQNGTGPRIPNGRIVAGTQVNVGYSWHLEDVQFADMTIELCDGRPSMVEREGVTFGGGRFCPWAAEVVEIQ